MPKKPQVIALEEHYFDPEVRTYVHGLDATTAPRIVERLDDLGALRLKEMDEAGIDIQVLGHANPSLQKLDATTAVPLARRVNDRLYEAVQRHPDRFAAFAALPTADPKAAADELERAVTRLGFKGAMIHGLTNGVFHDDKRFGRSMSKPPHSMCRFTCIRASRSPRSSKPITRSISANTRTSCAPPGVSRSRLRPRQSG